MYNLPSDLYELDYCSLATASYIDTGIIPNTSTEIDITFYCPEVTDTFYILGCRNSSSAGNFRLYKYTAYYIFNYSNTTNNLTNIKYNDGNVRLIIKNLTLDMFSDTHTQEVELSDGAFATPAQYSIHLGGYNNAGNHIDINSSNSNIKICECKIWQSGNLVRHYIPYYKRTEEGGGWNTIESGMYELVQETKHTVSEITSSSTSFLPLAITSINGYVTGDTGWRAFYNVRAIANKGYHFKKWKVNLNGTITEYIENPTTLYIEDDIFASVRSLEAVFEKNAEDTILPFRAYVKDKYNLAALSKCDLKVINGSFKNDLLQKSTSTIYVDKLASNVKIGDYICVYSPTNSIVFKGIIKSIDEDNKMLQCRELQSIYDIEYMFSPNTSVDGQNLTKMPIQRALVNYYLNYLRSGCLDISGVSQERQTTDIFGVLSTNKVAKIFKDANASFYGELIPDACPLFDSRKISNFETWLFDLYKEYGIYPNFIIPFNNDYCYVTMKYNNEEALTLSSNNEEIKDINVIFDDSQTSSSLVVFNLAGTTLRYVYTLNSDNVPVCILKGSTRVEPVGFVHTDKYNPKIVMSDDKINTILKQVFYSNTYNHKITFTVNLDGKFNMDEFTIGRSVNFYNQGTLYNSVLTAIDFDLERDTNRISSIKITLGKVRTSLTSKLNLGYVK